jgi:high-affinity iron transporter
VFGYYLAVLPSLEQNTDLPYQLGIIFAGKGIAALQEAGVLMSNPVTFYHIDLPGIYPNLQGLLVQLCLTVLAFALWQKKSL